MDSQWITDGCAEARRLVEAGQSETAADVLAYVETRALGIVGPKAWQRRRDARRRATLCSFKGCKNPRSVRRPWCRWCGAKMKRGAA